MTKIEYRYHQWQFVNKDRKKKWFCPECRGWTDNAAKGNASKKTCPGKPQTKDFM